MVKQDSFRRLISGEKPIFIDFHATWCGPCKAMEPIIKDLAEDLNGRARIIKIDIDKNSQLASQLGIRGVPTFALYQKGKQLWRNAGMMTLDQLKQDIQNHIG